MRKGQSKQLNCALCAIVSFILLFINERYFKDIFFII